MRASDSPFSTNHIEDDPSLGESELGGTGRRRREEYDSSRLAETLPQDPAQLNLAKERSLNEGTVARQVPGYDLQDRLGRGSYGEVWLAIDRNTGRKVAIKFFSTHKGLDWPLLKREVGKLVQAVGERRIVHLLKVGWDADPPYYVMEYLEGGSLADRLEGGPLPIGQAVRWFWEVAHALAYLHGKAILHCDLKPANVLLDESDQIRLADFGQARLSEETTPAFGTLFYMAPEQTQSQARPDVRADIYSLGALLYAMLLGAPPYSTPESRERLASEVSLHERMAKYRTLVEESPRPARHHTLSGMDRDLAEVLDRCLRHNPQDRYENVQQVIDALRSRFRRRQQRPLLIFSLLGPLVLLVSLAVLGLFAEREASRVANKTLTRQILEDHHKTSEILGVSVDRNLKAIQRRIERESQAAKLRQWIQQLDEPETRSARQTAIDNLQNRLSILESAYRDRHFRTWVLADAEGRVLASSPSGRYTRGASVQEQEWFHGRSGLELQERVVEPLAPRQRTGSTNSYRLSEEGPLSLDIATPVWSEMPASWQDSGAGDVVGVLSAQLDLSSFYRWLDEAEQTPNADGCPSRFVSLLYREQLIRHPCSVGEGRMPVASEQFFQHRAVQQLVAEQVSQQFADPLRPGQVYLATSKQLVEFPDWRLIVQQERSEALSPIEHLVGRFGLMARIVGAIGLAIVGTLWFLILRMNREEKL